MMLEFNVGYLPLTKYLENEMGEKFLGERKSWDKKRHRMFKKDGQNETTVPTFRPNQEKNVEN